ncbi:undecaprenyldiphospho-muramoylpentapeptide beta-N-acetylglucosaminyltransferase [Schaalia vaccimaxillae]|uniref:undecaprenyldiphospho-muramoylpentapeptide beta-N-acetylglucosaminyltransferase n=1 Tax=Schaalia vaccimaxillae TaxID=183916 RepID=UPI0003B6CC7A|nr:undecaprenyldiphospho-muramoylpentapeptide beta-N-acetylglucosaminyltransferase [Schaalia vaccimaxillae]
MNKKIVMAGGGTAGHVNPLLATAHELRAQGCDVQVLGTAQGLESDLVPAQGFDLIEIPRVPLPRRPSLEFFSLPSRWRRAVRTCMQSLEGADALVGFGGYVSTPAYVAAKRLGVPIIVHEQNARPGLANKVGARSAALVAVTFASTPLRARRGQTVVTGLPLREQIARLARQRSTEEGARAARVEASARLGVNPDLRTVLVTGGSLGAVHINEAVSGAAASLPSHVQIVHLTGKGKDEDVRRTVNETGVAERWLVVDYLTTMEDALAVADLVVCRSGAGTVAEMTALGLPCVYVPLPIGNGEQKLNAQDHVGAGGALMIEDEKLTPKVVVDDVLTLVGTSRLADMAGASRNLGRVDAAADLAARIMSIANAKEEA